MKAALALRTCAAVVLFATLGPRAALIARAPADLDVGVDKIFSKWNATTPGCAVGVGIGGKPVLLKAYGMADLEHDVPNTPETIFEAGSVSKQFTAMAVLLLARDGKLSIDDAVKKYIPEIPDYGAPLTIRHMLSHTSGLRDWGSVESIAGWPRTTRAYTHAHVLDIVSRQRSLNFPSGTDWSYSNTGFNLAAIIVQRVSGQSLAEFSRHRIFGPLGMTRTSWRDDYTQIVKGRAIAYAEDKGAFHTQMPFESIYGNGGLLTTVGDLLKWNENYMSANPTVGSTAMVAEQERASRTTDGKELDYALGLYVNPYRGVRTVSHSGSTAGYRAHLSHFPESRTSIAVLCNVSTGDATQSNNAIADIVLADRLKPAPPRQAPPRPPAAMTPAPSAAALADFAGSYWSDDAEVMITAKVDNSRLVAFRRPDSNIVLTPTAPDTFQGAGLGRIKFVRDGSGGVSGFSVTQERVWDLRFTRK